jgi:nondiscriminating glutamyl-tRNA synthetase
MNMEPVQERDEIRIHFGITPRNPIPLEDARIALIGNLLARKKRGQLIGTIQDLEKEHSPEVRKSLHSMFQWLGIEFEDRPFDGESGQFWQSRRIFIYKDFLLKLLNAEKAYLIPYETEKNENIFQNSGTKAKAPSLTEACLPDFEMDFLNIKNDGIFEVFLRTKSKSADTFATSELQAVPEKIKLWSFDGKPASCLANCVDRHLKQITHVVCRDEQYVECLKENLILEAFGWKPIQYLLFSKINSRVDTIVNGLKSRLGSIDEMERSGYLPQVMIQYLEQGSESLFLDADVRFIHIDCQGNFEIDYLNELNQTALQKTDPETLFILIRPYLDALQVSLDDKSRIDKILSLLKMHYQSLSLLAEGISVFFKDKPLHYSASARSVLRRDGSQKVLWSFLRRAREVESMTKEVFLSIMKNVQHETGIIGKDLWDPIRIALTGHSNAYELALAAEIIGKDACVARIKAIVGNFW